MFFGFLFVLSFIVGRLFCGWVCPARETEWVMYFMTVAIIFIVAILSGKRGFCHYVCWVSPFMIIGGEIRDSLKIPSLRLITNPELCNSCGLCTRSCPMSIPVDELIRNEEIGHSECTLCSECTDSCPKNDKWIFD